MLAASQRRRKRSIGFGVTCRTRGQTLDVHQLAAVVARALQRVEPAVEVVGTGVGWHEQFARDSARRLALRARRQRAKTEQR